MTKLNFLPNRRWLQFRLRTVFIVVTVVALSLGWWRHRDYCLARANSHQESQIDCLVETIDAGGHRWIENMPPQPVDTQRVAEDARLTQLAEEHRKTSESFRLAVWFPWLRWSINERPIEVELQQRQTP